MLGKRKSFKCDEGQTSETSDFSFFLFIVFKNVSTLQFRLLCRIENFGRKAGARSYN